MTAETEDADNLWVIADVVADLLALGVLLITFPADTTGPRRDFFLQSNASLTASDMRSLVIVRTPPLLVKTIS